MRCQVVWAAALIANLTVVAVARGDPAEDVLTGRGLRKLSSCFALPDESEMSKGIRQAESLKRDLLDAQKEMARRRKVVEQKRKVVVACMEQRRQLRQQLDAARSVEARNRVVAAMNELGDRLVLLLNSKTEEQSLQAAMTKVGQLTEQYIERLLKLRELYDRVTAKYQAIAGDSAVKQALESYNKSSQRTYSLGPSPTFLSYGRRLAKLEESVFSDTIDLHRGKGGLWHVNVVFNGSHSADMAIDTGASTMVLPWKIAQEVGVKPSDDDQTVRLQTADGRVMSGKMVIVDKVRVGRFTVENVECAVMPPEMPRAVPLLGLSFFKHFNFRIDNAGGKLTLARVDSEESGRAGGGR